MDWIPLLIALITGIVLGFLIAYILRIIQAKTAKELTAELLAENEKYRQDNIETIINQIRTHFGALSLKVLSRSTDELLKLAKSKLESERIINQNELAAKKGLIDQELKRMTETLENVTNLMKTLEKDRVEKFSKLTTQMHIANEQTSVLMHTTNKLQQALANTKARGQWGERMADDVLKMAGFLENVNYLKQHTNNDNISRPDFTFLLPRNLKLNMDVKFPFNNYIRFLEAHSEADRAIYRQMFLKDVKARIKEVTTRDYINPDDNTVDYVLLFIPNEQIYTFIHEHDSLILDEGIKNRVVICSPVTLYAVLAVIRQAVDNFTLEQTSNEILSLLGAFKNQWEKFLMKLDGLGKRIFETQKEYESLITTRRHQLEKQLNKIDNLRNQRGLPIAEN